MYGDTKDDKCAEQKNNDSIEERIIMTAPIQTEQYEQLFKTNSPHQTNYIIFCTTVFLANKLFIYKL